MWSHHIVEYRRTLCSRMLERISLLSRHLELHKKITRKSNEIVTNKHQHRYEILSSMVASEDEFLQHKDRIVEDVQDNLRHLARIEAELLFREFNANGRKIALPQISNRISQAIIRTHDAIYNMLGNEEENQHVLSDQSDTTREIIMDRVT